MGCHSLLQGIFPTQGSNLGLLHGRQILYRLSQSRYARVYLFSFTVNYIYDVWSQSKKLRETTFRCFPGSIISQASIRLTRVGGFPPLCSCRRRSRGPSPGRDELTSPWRPGWALGCALRPHPGARHRSRLQGPLPDTAWLSGCPGRGT